MNPTDRTLTMKLVVTDSKGVVYHVNQSAVDVDNLTELGGSVGLHVDNLYIPKPFSVRVELGRANRGEEST